MEKILEQLSMALVHVESLIRDKAPLVYGIVKKQILLEGAVEATCSCLFAACGFCLLLAARRLRKNLQYTNDKDDWMPWFGAIAFLLTFALGIAAFLRLANPDYYTIKHLLDCLAK